MQEEWAANSAIPDHQHDPGETTNTAPPPLSVACECTCTHTVCTCDRSHSLLLCC